MCMHNFICIYESFKHGILIRIYECTKCGQTRREMN